MPWETDADGGQALAEFAGRACYQSWDKPNPATATNAGLPAAHPRGRPPVGARARHGERCTSPASPGRSTHELIRHRHFSYSQLSQRYVPERDAAFVEPAVIAEDPELHERVPRRHRRRAGRLRRAARRPGEATSPTSRTRPCAASRPARPPARCCPTRPRPASSSPATTAPGGTSSPCGPASTPTSRSASWRSPACASCSGSRRQRVRRLPDQRPGRRHRGRGQPVRHRGLSPWGSRSVGPGPYPRDRGRHAGWRAPIDTQYEDLLRRILEQGTPKQDRTGTGTRQPVRRAAALRPVRALPADHHEEGALPLDRRRAAVVPARRQQRRLAAGARRDDLGRVGRPRGRARPGLRRPVAVVADPGRRARSTRSRRSCSTRCAPTPTRAA